MKGEELVVVERSSRPLTSPPPPSPLLSCRQLSPPWASSSSTSLNGVSAPAGSLTRELTHVRAGNSDGSLIKTAEELVVGGGGTYAVIGSRMWCVSAPLASCGS